MKSIQTLFEDIPEIKLSHWSLLSKTFRNSHLITRTLIALNKFCVSNFKLLRVNCSCSHFFISYIYIILFSFSWLTCSNFGLLRVNCSCSHFSISYILIVLFSFSWWLTCKGLGIPENIQTGEVEDMEFPGLLKNRMWKSQRSIKKVKFHVSEIEKWNFRISNKSEICSRGLFQKSMSSTSLFGFFSVTTQYRFHFEIYPQSRLLIRNSLCNFCTVEQKANLPSWSIASNFEIKLQA